jgi:hypothetical protein
MVRAIATWGLAKLRSFTLAKTIWREGPPGLRIACTRAYNASGRNLRCSSSRVQATIRA